MPCHMKPLKPLKAPLLPLTLSDEASSVGFLSLGLSLMFCAPPVMPSQSKVWVKVGLTAVRRKKDCGKDLPRP